MSTAEKSSPGATLFAVCVSGFLMPFMLSGVGVALPSLGNHFSANAVELGLVETGYMASVSLFMLTAGRLADIHGRRRAFLIGLALFSAIGGLISFAWSIWSVIVLRFLQGIGGALVAATGPAIVVSVFPPEKRGRALGVLVASIYAGLSCGPLVGGALVSWLGWRALFYPILPLGLLLVIVAGRNLKGEWAEARGEPFDLAGSIVYAVAILAMTGGAGNLSKGGWAWLLLGLGVLALIGFGAHQHHVKYPILDVRMLRANRVFAFSNLAALFNYAATFGVTFFLSLYLQYVKGLPPHTAGLVLVTQPVTQAVLSPACGRLADRVPADRVATLGMAICAAGLFAAALIGEDTGMIHLMLILAALGVGFALFSSPNTSVIMGSVEKKHLGVASGFSSSMRTLGMMTSMTIITIILSILMGGHAVTPDTHPAFISSMRWGFSIYAILCVTGVALSFGRLQPAAAKKPEPEATDS